MKANEINKLTLAGMFAALAFICFAYLRIEIPMGGGMTGKIYIGHTFIILAAALLGSKYGALTGAVGLSLADFLAGYTTSAPPTFLAKFLLGYTAAFTARTIFNLPNASPKKQIGIIAVSGISACIVNVITEPLIRYAFKVYILGMPQELAYLSAVNCAVSMAVSAVPSVILAALLYKVLYKNIFKNYQF